MKAVILAGGLGTRISEETHLKPKPMIEIGGKPILWHKMCIRDSFKVAHHLGVRAFAIAPAWLLEPGKGGGFFANSEYLESRKMEKAFAERSGKPVSYTHLDVYKRQY